jgi:hypothetical protein
MTDENPVDVALENRLMSHGVYVARVEWLGDSPDSTMPDDGAGMALEYETVSAAPGVTSDEVGAVVRTLLSIADEREWTPGRFEATSRTTDGDLRGKWHVDGAWFDELGTALSETEFSGRVLETVEGSSSDA